jgi:hypothetical protein
LQVHKRLNNLTYTDPLKEKGSREDGCSDASTLNLLPFVRVKRHRSLFSCGLARIEYGYVDFDLPLLKRPAEVTNTVRTSRLEFAKV